MYSSTCVLAGVLLAVVSVKGQTTCNTPNSEPGQCIPFHDCKPLMDIIRKPKRTNQESALLWRSSCKSINKVLAVCCPVQSIPNPRNDCITPEGSEGRCINMNSCGYVSGLLKSMPIPQQTIDYLKRTTCKSSDPYSVCCDSKPAEERLPSHRDKCVTSSSAFPPDPSSGCCGRDANVGDKIVGGDVTAVDMYPWLALIEYFIDNFVMKTLCGGSLISSRYVLTAAHCVVGEVLSHGKPRHVRLGEYDSQNEGRDCAPTVAHGSDCTNGVLRIGIEKIITHPQYDLSSVSSKHDIALIRLNAMAPFSDFIRPICLPATDILASPPHNLTLFAAGWGSILGGTRQVLKSPVKMHVEVPFINRNQCEANYRSVENVTFGDGQICAGGEDGKDTCQGDSGGPLMYENGRTFELLGVVSYGHIYCATKNVPGIYTKVFQYKDWIKNNIEP